jgi:hypothetical protein
VQPVSLRLLTATHSKSLQGLTCFNSGVSLSIFRAALSHRASPSAHTYRLFNF